MTPENQALMRDPFAKVVPIEPQSADGTLPTASSQRITIQ
jgi:hypothetical protein